MEEGGDILNTVRDIIMKAREREREREREEEGNKV